MRTSILFRLTLWNASVLACMLVLFAAAGWITLDRAVAQRTASTVRESARAVAGAILAERRAAAARGEVEEERGAYEKAVLRELRVGDLDIFITDDAVQLMAVKQPRVADDLTPEPREADQRSDERPIEIPMAVRAEMNHVRQERLDGTLSDSAVAVRRVVQSDSSFRVAMLRVEPDADDHDEPPLLITVVMSEAEDRALLRQVRTTLFFAIPLALLVSIAVGFLLARRSLEPLEAINARTATISAANLDERLPVVNPHDELGRLAQIINGLLERVDSAFRTQRQFVADASHELRTPLAIIRGEADVTLRRPQRPEDEYREAMTVVHAESLRLSRIVDDLFLLARTDAGGALTAPLPIDPQGLVTSVLRSVRTLADERHVTLQASLEALDGDCDIRGEESLLRRLLLNLLDNALKHAPRGSTIHVAARTIVDTDERFIGIRVQDEGPGIAPDLRARVFERFVHGVASDMRSATSTPPGAGLGLAIAQAIAHAHGGRIELLEVPIGTAFEVQLPTVAAVAEHA
ncbi:MAG: HAMP domain-containing protein [Gemmatimonadaceae bacterium]|nr:HAMP domain-containing protein [Gemmatimonadaceae bacterium]